LSEEVIWTAPTTSSDMLGQTVPRRVAGAPNLRKTSKILAFRPRIRVLHL
jgi:hypothetical protein